MNHEGRSPDNAQDGLHRREPSGTKVVYAPRSVLVACRSEFVTADAAGGVGVFPLDGPGMGGVGVDVAPKLSRQIRDGGEDAARNDLAFDLGEPDLDLVEP